jgi:hypothetical protein
MFESVSVKVPSPARTTSKKSSCDAYKAASVRCAAFHGELFTFTSWN